MTAVAPRGRSYYALHSARKYATGSASLYPCSVPGCPNGADHYAFRPLPGVSIRTEVVNGSVLSWQDDIDSLRPECARHHHRTDAVLRRGRCLIADAEAFLADYIDANGQLLLSSRVYAEADALGLNRFVLRDLRREWGIETRTFYVTGGRGCVAVWLVPDAAVPAPNSRAAGPT